MSLRQRDGVDHQFVRRVDRGALCSCSKPGCQGCHKNAPGRPPARPALLQASVTGTAVSGGHPAGGQAAASPGPTRGQAGAARVPSPGKIPRPGCPKTTETDSLCPGGHLSHTRHGQGCTPSETSKKEALSPPVCRRCLLSSGVWTHHSCLCGQGGAPVLLLKGQQSQWLEGPPHCDLIFTNFIYCDPVSKLGTF